MGIKIRFPKIKIKPIHIPPPYIPPPSKTFAPVGNFFNNVGKTTTAIIIPQIVNSANVVANTTTNIIIPEIVSVSNTVANEVVSVSNTIANETVSASNILANKTTEYANVVGNQTTEKANIFVNEIKETAVPVLQNTAVLIGSKMQSVVLPNLLNALQLTGNYLSTGLGGLGGQPEQGLSEEDLKAQEQQLIGLYVIGGVFGLTAVYLILR